MSWSPATEAHPGLAERLGGAGLRTMIRLAQWKGRREAEKALGAAPDQHFRGFIQINLIRSR